MKLGEGGARPVRPRMDVSLIKALSKPGGAGTRLSTAVKQSQNVWVKGRHIRRQVKGGEHGWVGGGGCAPGSMDGD